MKPLATLDPQSKEILYGHGTADEVLAFAKRHRVGRNLYLAMEYHHAIKDGDTLSTYRAPQCIKVTWKEFQRFIRDVRDYPERSGRQAVLCVGIANDWLGISQISNVSEIETA